MGKTIEEIRSRFYNELKNSDLSKEIKGRIFEEYRENGSTAEDVVFYDFGVNDSSLQEAFFILNIYVPDIHNGTEFKKDKDRCSHLTRVAWDVLDNMNLGDFAVQIEKQSSFTVQDVNNNQHGIRFELTINQF